MARDWRMRLIVAPPDPAETQRGGVEVDRRTRRILQNLHALSDYTEIGGNRGSYTHQLDLAV